MSNVFKRSIIGLAVVGTVAGGYAYLGLHPIAQANAFPAAAAPAPAIGGAAITLPDFSSIVDRYGPAVVNISVTGMTKTSAVDQSPFGNLDPNDPFYQFFRQFRAPQQQGGVPTHGLGSGFIVSPDGVILTNAHVVADASEVVVKLTDKREFKAKVIGVDKPSDIAVIKIEAKNLPTVTLGDDHAARVGEWVLAIGAPFGFENSVTAGIISAKSRALPDENYVPFIQTDVAVNPGNSGGPLFNLKGQVIGINSQIYSRSGGYQGLSFSIPIDVAVKVKDEILAHGKVTRGRIGVGIQEVNQSLADSFGLPKPEGALISSVDAAGPAAKAGLKPGDVILKLNGQDVADSNALPPEIASLTPGSTATLQVWRDHKAQDVKVSIGENKDTKVATATTGGDHGPLGVAVRPLTPQERSQAEVSNGLLVEAANGPAARAGIEPGDVILSVNGRPVNTAAELRALSANGDKHIALLIERDNQRIFVPIDLG